MSDIEPSAEQRIHLMGEPVDIVRQWLRAIFDEGDLVAAWALMDAILRLAQAQGWMYLTERDQDPQRDAMAAKLADPGVSRESGGFGAELTSWQIEGWRQMMPAYVSDATRRGIVPIPQPIAVDLEAVMVGEAGTHFEAGEPLEVYRFLVRRTEAGYRLAGIGGALPVPGWPPSSEPVQM